MSNHVVNDSVLWYMNELTSRIVAESGTPSDRHHLGKILLQSFKDDPDLVSQTDGATNESETSASLLQRAVKCATCFRNMGMERGDVMVLMAPHHLDLAVPFYAALFVGVAIAAVDMTLGLSELQSTFAVDQPKIIFCQSEKAPDVQITLNELEMNAQIVTFEKGDYLLSFQEFMDKYGDDTTVEDFKPAEFDPEETIAFLVATSGTTGMPKAAVVTHKNIAITNPYLWSRFSQFPGPTRLALLGAPLQWLSALIICINSTIMRYPRLISSLPLTQTMAYQLINTYRISYRPNEQMLFRNKSPSFAILSPTMMTTLLKHGDRDQCDFTSFDLIMLGGSAVPPDLIDDIKEVSPETEAINIYGMSELTNIAFHGVTSPLGSCGKPMGCFQYRIVDLETMRDVDEPKVPGELWMKGPGIFREYYKNPEATEETFAEDRWFKTGDMFYRDENDNYFFVERIKLLLKYKSYQISPVELEVVIRQHPGVADVAVTGIPDPECGELPVACVVPQPGLEPSAQEIKDLIKESLSDSKQLRGGVIFLSEIPVTASTKVHRRKLKELAMTMERE